MTIEQEFFEAFGIRKIRRCELDDECFMGFGHSCEECDIYGQAYEVYPPITPEIVLGLIEILIKMNKWFLVRNRDNTKFNWYRFENPCIGSEESDDVKDCTLYLFLTLNDEEKDEIQDQVKALFNA